MSNKKRVAVALSGGLDSSVVCRLLLSQGYNVVAVTAKMIDDENFSQIAEKAGAVADKLEIPHYIIDLSKDFKSRIIDYFENSYKSGLTPNPCIFCNKKNYDFYNRMFFFNANQDKRNSRINNSTNFNIK